MSALLGQVWRYLMEEEPPKKTEEVKDPSPEKEEYRKEEHSCCGRSSCSETKREPEVTDTDCGGPEDGDGTCEDNEPEDRLPKSGSARPVREESQSSVKNLGQLTIDTLRELLTEERAAALVGPKLSEQYPSNFVHVTLHINPNTGDIHYDGDKRIDSWLKEIMAYHDAKRSNPHSCLSALAKLRNWLAKK